MSRDERPEGYSESVGLHMDAGQAGDGGGRSCAASEAGHRLPEGWPIERIRETIGPTVEEWLRDYGLHRDKSHTQLVNRLAAAVYAMLSTPPHP